MEKQSNHDLFEADVEALHRTGADLDAPHIKHVDLYENAPVGYFILNANGVIQECNSMGTALLQLAKGTLVGQPFSKFIHPDNLALYSEHLSKLLDTGVRNVCEIKMIKNDHQLFWARIEACITISSNRVPYCLAVVCDITQQKRADKERMELEEKNLRLQKSESLGRMAGAIAHHFNNQLQTVMLSLELTKNELAQGKKAAKFLKDAMEAVHRAAEISNLMLTYLGQEHGKQEPVDLSNVCRQRLAFLQNSTLEKVPVGVHLPLSGPAITANVNEIQQLLTNLLTNAREAIGDALSPIDLTVKTAAPSDIPTMHRFPVGWEPHDRAYACLEVSDSGCGIKRSDIENLFDPFFSSKFVGRGLGLAVVLGIVRAHKGVVTVESEPGHGSVFRVFLPLSAVPPDSLQPQFGPKSQKKNLGTVLLVDDNASLRELAATAIQGLGFTVFEANDGIDAMEVYLAHRNEIRLVVCDLTMPRMNGWATLDALRKIEPNLPVVLSSGYDEDKVMQGNHPERPNAFLRKPYVIRELEEAIFKILNEQAEMVQNPHKL